MLLIPNHAIFIKTNKHEKREFKKRKKVDAGGKNDSREDDKLMFLRGPDVTS